MGDMYAACCLSPPEDTGQQSPQHCFELVLQLKWRDKVEVGNWHGNREKKNRQKDRLGHMYQFVIYHSLEFFFSILVATVHMHTKGHTSDSVKAKGIFNPYAFWCIWNLYGEFTLISCYQETVSSAQVSFYHHSRWQITSAVVSLVGFAFCQNTLSYHHQILGP